MSDQTPVERRTTISDIVGEVLAYIDTDESNSEILLTTASGRRFKIHHVQSCCESVRLIRVDGQFITLVGHVLIEVCREENARYDFERNTWTMATALTFRVDGSTVVSRWFGESNGMYSESIDITELVG